MIPLFNRIVRLLNAVPYSLLAIPLRLAIAETFWASGMVKLDDWQATLALFAEEYKLPLIPPVLGAYMSATIELTTPALLVLGLFTRPVAVVLLGMITVIEVFVYPEAWPDHLRWASILLVLLCRGAGAVSLDAVIARVLRTRPAVA